MTPLSTDPYMKQMHKYKNKFNWEFNDIRYDIFLCQIQNTQIYRL